jgi:hypothetical protein
MPSASVVIPTRERPAYLGVRAWSGVPAGHARAEVIVIDDAGESASR